MGQRKGVSNYQRHLESERIGSLLKEQGVATHDGLAGWGKSLSARQNVTGLHVWDKPGLSG
jgi:hypothetical protein